MSFEVISAFDGLSSLDDNSIQLVYMDPPYNTGRDFYNFNDKFESSADYRDNLIRPIIELIYKKLKKNGTVVIHVEPKISHHIRIVCDDVFGEKRFVNEIVWKSGGNHNTNKKLQRNHDTIIVYSKSNNQLFNPEFKPYSEELVKGCKKDERGYYRTSALKNSQPEVTPRPNLRYEWNNQLHQWHISIERMRMLHNDNRLEYPPSGIPRVKKYFHELGGVQVKDIWDDISQIQMGEKLDYATQKPVKLLERIIKMYSNVGDVVCDPFAGSGTTGRASIATEREYILFDINPEAKELFDSTIGGRLPL